MSPRNPLNAKLSIEICFFSFISGIFMESLTINSGVKGVFFVLFCLRASWLKESNPEAEQLFSMVAEVFIFWAKSHVRMTCIIFIIF